MPITRGMFGAPVYLADAPDIIGNADKLSEMQNRTRLVDVAEKNQQSLAQERQAEVANKRQQVLTNRLNSYIQMSPDNPKLATQALNSDHELLNGLGLKEGQYEFQGKSGKAIVVKDTYGGKTWLITPGEQDPSKAVMQGPDITPKPTTKGELEAGDYASIPQAQRVAGMAAKLAGGGKTPRARTRLEVAAGALGGNPDDAKLLAATGGINGYAAALARRGAGADVSDPDVGKMTPRQAKVALAELGKTDAGRGLMQQALGADPAYGGTAAPEDGGGDAAAGDGGGVAGAAAPAAAPAGDGFIRFRNAAGQVIRTKDPNLAPPPGFEPLQ